MAADWVQQLLDEGIISPEQLAEAEDMAASLGTTIADALVKLGYVTGDVVGRAQAEHYGYEFFGHD